MLILDCEVDANLFYAGTWSKFLDELPLLRRDTFIYQTQLRELHLHRLLIYLHREDDGQAPPKSPCAIRPSPRSSIPSSLGPRAWRPKDSSHLWRRCISPSTRRVQAHRWISAHGELVGAKVSCQAGEEGTPGEAVEGRPKALWGRPSLWYFSLHLSDFSAYVSSLFSALLILCVSRSPSRRSKYSWGCIQNPDHCTAQLWCHGARSRERVRSIWSYWKSMLLYPTTALMAIKRRYFSLCDQRSQQHRVPH